MRRKSTKDGEKLKRENMQLEDCETFDEEGKDGIDF